MREFAQMSSEDQRAFLDSPDGETKAKVTNLFKILMMLISMVSSEPDLVLWALAMVNGIIEDSRYRIEHLYLL